MGSRGLPEGVAFIEQETKMMKTKKVIQVQSGENLAAILKAFPQAEVHTLISHPGEDAWRVEIEVEVPEVQETTEEAPTSTEEASDGSPGTLVLTARKRPQRRPRTSQGKDHVHEWVKIRKPQRGWRYRCKVCGQKARKVPE